MLDRALRSSASLPVFATLVAVLFGIGACATSQREGSGSARVPAGDEVVVKHAPYSLVDLHTHLFMEHGMGLMFHGGFDTPIQATSYTDRFSSQINAATLNASNLGIVVVALYAHPIFAPHRERNIRAQIAAAENFVKEYPQWIIAKSPDEARAAIASGKRVLVLSIEGAGDMVDTEALRKEFIDEKGVRIVTFAHLTDDHLGGAAFMPGFKRVATPTGWFRTILQGSPERDGVAVNSMGLTQAGYRAARALIKRKVWIDLSHAPDKMQDELEPLLREAGQPLLYTHIAMRKYYKAEREISQPQLERLRDWPHGGLLGIVPANEVFGDIAVPPKLCPESCKGKCKGGVHALGAEFDEIGSIIGYDRVMMGSDFNGAMQHLEPSSCPTGTSLDDKAGYFEIGQSSEVWYALKRMGAPVNASAYEGAENFIRAWEKVVKGQK